MSVLLNPTIAPDFKLTAIEETEHWSPTVTEKTGRIWTVFLYDASRQIHCCEITPSFELNPAYFVTENVLDDDTQETVQRNFDWDVKYVHCRSVTPMHDIGNLFTNSRFSDLDIDDDDQYRKGVDDYLADITCNGNPLDFSGGRWWPEYKPQGRPQDALSNNVGLLGL